MLGLDIIELESAAGGGGGNCLKLNSIQLRNIVRRMFRPGLYVMPLQDEEREV